MHLSLNDAKYLARLRKPILGHAPKRIAGVGNMSLADRRSVAVLSSRDIASGALLALRSLMEDLRELPLALVGGWHSPPERECLELSSPRHAIVVCAAKGLPLYEPPAIIVTKLGEGKALVLTHCADSVRRISRERSLRANEIAISLSRCVLTLGATVNSEVWEMLHRTLEAKVPVCALDHPSNESLLRLGMERATRDFFERHCIMEVSDAAGHH